MLQKKKERKLKNMNFNTVREYNEAWKNDDGTMMSKEEINAEIAEYRKHRGYDYDGYINAAVKHLFTSCWVD